jgi:hypothetical protein
VDDRGLTHTTHLAQNFAGPPTLSDNINLRATVR